MAISDAAFVVLLHNRDLKHVANFQLTSSKVGLEHGFGHALFDAFSDLRTALPVELDAVELEVACERGVGLLTTRFQQCAYSGVCSLTCCSNSLQMFPRAAASA